MKSPATRALVQESLNRSNVQIQRAAVRHGIPGPVPPRTILGDFVDKPEPTTTTTPAIMQPTTTTPSTILPAVLPAAVSRVRNRVPGWAKVGLGAAVAGPLTAAAVALGYYLKGDGDTTTTTVNNPPVITQPVTPQPPTGTTTSQGGDLLEWLEREGYNR